MNLYTFYLQTHRETEDDRFFSVSGVQFEQSNRDQFNYHHVVFSSILKSKWGSIPHPSVTHSQTLFAWSEDYLREVKLYEVWDFFGEVKWKLVKSSTVRRGGAQVSKRKLLTGILYKVNRCKLGSLQCVLEVIGDPSRWLGVKFLFIMNRWSES